MLQPVLHGVPKFQPQNTVSLVTNSTPLFGAGTSAPGSVQAIADSLPKATQWSYQQLPDEKKEVFTFNINGQAYRLEIVETNMPDTKSNNIADFMPKVDENGKIDFSKRLDDMPRLKEYKFVHIRRGLLAAEEQLVKQAIVPAVYNGVEQAYGLGKGLDVSNHLIKLAAQTLSGNANLKTEKNFLGTSQKQEAQVNGIKITLKADKGITDIFSDKATITIDLQKEGQAKQSFRLNDQNGKAAYKTLLQSQAQVKAEAELAQEQADLEKEMARLLSIDGNTLTPEKKQRIDRDITKAEAREKELEAKEEQLKASRKQLVELTKASDADEAKPKSQGKGWRDKLNSKLNDILS